MAWERLPEPTSFAAYGNELAAQYQGTVNTTVPNNALIGWAYYIRQGSSYEVIGPTGHGQQYNPPNDRGTFAYEADAEAAVRGVGDIAAFVRDGQTQRYPNRVTAFTEGTPANHKLREIQYLPDPNGKGGFNVTAKHDGTGFELTPARPPSLPEVTTIPEATATSPNAVFLLESYTEGTKSDATLTVGFGGGLAGYVDSAIGTPIGSISERSTILGFYGVGTAGAYVLDYVASFSDDAIQNLNLVSIDGTNYDVGVEIAMGGLFLKRVLNAPSLSAGTASINYRFGTKWYFNDGVGETFDAGGWEKTDDGSGTLAYHKLTTLGLVHRDSVGPPTYPPSRPGQGDVDDLGRLWLTAGKWIFNHLSATGTASPFTNAQYVPHPATRPDILSDGGDGGFTWVRNGGQNGFRQYQGTAGSDYRENLLWNGIGGVWDYIAEHVHTSGAAHDLAEHFRDNSVFLGGFDSRSAAIAELALRIVDTEFAVDTWIYGDNRVGVGGLHVITTFNGGSTVRSNNFTWVGPHATIANISEYFEQHFHDQLGLELLSSATVEVVPNDIDQTYSFNVIGGAPPTPSGAMLAIETVVALGGVAYMPVNVVLSRAPGVGKALRITVTRTLTNGVEYKTSITVDADEWLAMPVNAVGTSVQATSAFRERYDRRDTASTAQGGTMYIQRADNENLLIAVSTAAAASIVSTVSVRETG